MTWTERAGREEKDKLIRDVGELVVEQGRRSISNNRRNHGRYSYLYCACANSGWAGSVEYLGLCILLSRVRACN